MYIRLLSDLHLETNRGFRYIYGGEDVLVLAGDIHTRNRHHTLIEQIPSEVRVVMVAGNHEYWHQTISEVDDYLHGLQEKFSNFTFLKNRGVVIDGVNFFGGTMYSDFTLDMNPLSKLHANRIRDFQFIANPDGSRWTVDDHEEAHEEFRKTLKFWISETEGQKRVVISHFGPARDCIAPRWRGDILNPYFIGNMARYIGFEGLWLYGHLHDSYDNMLGDTRLVCNPFGYGNENPYFNNNLLLEI